MNVADVMTRGVDAINPDTTVRDAAAKMRDDDVGALVVSENGGAIGVVTDRDIICRAVATGEAGNVAVRRVMSGDVIACSESDSLEDAAKVMADKQVRRVPVRDAQGQVIGVLSLADMIRSGSEGEAAAVTALKGIEQPSRAARQA